MEFKSRELIEIFTKRLRPKRYELCHESITNDYYFVYSLNKSSIDLENSDIDVTFERWKKIFDLYYRKIKGSPFSTSDTSVWVDSEKNKLIPKLEMEEWVNLTVSNIRRFVNPTSKILEIGCGNGLILEQLIHHVDQYIGIESSMHAIESIKASAIWNKNKSKIKLFNLSAIELFKLEYSNFDFIIINSVCQYFPNLEYLINVLDQSGKKLKENSFVYIGDVRSYELSEVQYIERSKYDANFKDRKSIVRFFRQRERETLYNQVVFKNLSNILPWVNSSIVSNKIGVHKNEMNKYRYDVILFCKNKKLINNIYTNNLISLCWFKDKMTNNKINQIISNLSENQICSLDNYPNEKIVHIFSNNKNYFSNFTFNSRINDDINLVSLKMLCNKKNIYMEIRTGTNPFLLTLRFSKSLILLNSKTHSDSKASLINFSNNLTSVPQQELQQANYFLSTKSKIIVRQVDDKLFDLKG